MQFLKDGVQAVGIIDFIVCLVDNTLCYPRPNSQKGEKEH